MDTPRTPSTPTEDRDAPRAEPVPEVLHLVIAWSYEEPHRIGEAAPIEGRSVLGRGAARDDDPAPRVRFYQQRPPEPREMPPLAGSSLSRCQLELAPLGEGALEVTSTGSCPLIVHGAVVQRAVVRPGDTLTLQDTLVLLVVARRPRWYALGACAGGVEFPFGMPDAHGIVGESPAAWALREALARAGQAGHHVLVHGETGVGKELAARALHALSPRRGGAFLARAAATIPESLVDAELYGNAPGYPHAESPERRGLVGETDGGTLFLDEIGNGSLDLQTHVLRVLDRGGEHRRLGEAQARRSDFRLVATTNHSIETLDPELAARFATRIEVPGFSRRREDIPLLLRHLLTAARRDHPALTAPYFERRAGAPDTARVDPQLVEALIRHDYTHHLRELKRLLWVAIARSRHDFLTMSPELRAELRLDLPAPAPHPDAPGGDDAAGDTLEAEDRARLHVAIERGVQQIERGDVVPAEQVLAELSADGRGQE